MIKICEKNALKIEAALQKENGGAEAHTITAFQRVAKLAAQFEYRLEQAFLPLKHRVGAKATVVSGDKVSNSYQFRRQATQITIIRRSTAWYLAEVSKEMIYAEGGRKLLVLSDAQKKEDVVRLLKQI